nr:ribonuclease H-like domain-containing protein [Tanacetum cinerariifolium]
MESLSPQVVSAAKLPILNPNEFDLWKMRIEQYLLMTDYSLWESFAMMILLLPQELLKIDADDLEEIDLKWQMAMLTRKGHFPRECRSPKDTRRNAMTGVFKQMMNLPTMLSWSSHLQVLFLTIRDKVLVSLRQNPKNAEQERDDLKLKLEKFQTSSKNLSELLVSQTNDKTGLGYNSQVFTRAMSDCNDYISSGSDTSLPPSPIYDMYQSSNRYHAVPPPYTGTFMPPKHDLVFNNAPNYVKTDHPALNFKLSPTKHDNDLSHTHQPSAPIIEDWVFDSEDESETKTSQNVPSFVQPPKQVKYPRPSSKLVPITDVRPVTIVVPNTSVTRPRQSQIDVTKPNSPPRRHINRSPSLKASTFPPKVAAVKAPMVNAAQGVQEKWEWKPKCLVLYHGNPQHVLKDKGVIYGGCSRHMTWNMSYLSDFEELNGGYVAFGGNPKGGMISRKGKIRTGKLDFDDVYFVKELKFNLFSVSQMCGKNNSVLFTDTECLVLSPEFKLPDENQVLLRVPRENNIASCKTKPVSSVNQPLQRLHMDLFGPTVVKSLNKKSYFLVVTDDYSRFT